MVLSFISIRDEWKDWRASLVLPLVSPWLYLLVLFAVFIFDCSCKPPMLILTTLRRLGVRGGR